MRFIHTIKWWFCGKATYGGLGVCAQTYGGLGGMYVLKSKLSLMPHGPGQPALAGGRRSWRWWERGRTWSSSLSWSWSRSWSWSQSWLWSWSWSCWSSPGPRTPGPVGQKDELALVGRLRPQLGFSAGQPTSWPADFLISWSLDNLHWSTEYTPDIRRLGSWSEKILKRGRWWPFQGGVGSKLSLSLEQDYSNEKDLEVLGAGLLKVQGERPLIFCLHRSGPSCLGWCTTFLGRFNTFPS